ncbi:MAG: hypothetical protein Tsb0021_01600 [Chlamydiales bacterium]
MFNPIDSNKFENPYIDEYKLLRAVGNFNESELNQVKVIANICRNWFIEYGLIDLELHNYENLYTKKLDQLQLAFEKELNKKEKIKIKTTYKETVREHKKIVDELTLHIMRAYLKISPLKLKHFFYNKEKPYHSPQVNPLQRSENHYHRVNLLGFHREVARCFAEQFGFLSPSDIHIVKNLSALEVIENFYPVIHIRSLREYANFYMNIESIQEITVLNISPLLKTYTHDEMMEYIEAIEDLRYFDYLIPIAIKKEGNLALIFTHEELSQTNMNFAEILNSLVTITGYVPSQDDLIECFASIKPADVSLKEVQIPHSIIATEGPDNIPVIYKSYEEFLAFCQKKIQHIKSSAFYQEELTLRPKHLFLVLDITYDLIAGLKDFAENIPDKTLQIAYFRVNNALQEIQHHRHDLIRIANEIEIIDEQIRLIIAMASPYEKKDLSYAIHKQLSEGEAAVIPSDLTDCLQVYAKPSCMHALYNTVFVLMRQLNRPVEILQQKFSYFESSNVSLLKRANTQILDTTDFSEKGKLDLDPNKKIDIYMCEFTHNLHLEAETYKTEDVIGQIRYIMDRGYASPDGLTVILDGTLDFAKSKHVRELLKEFKDEILQKKLNIVWIRSTQKYDQAGKDKINAGLVMTINHPEKFQEFNQLMSRPEDQLEGLSFQGLTHYMKYGNFDSYRAITARQHELFFSNLPTDLKLGDYSDHWIHIAPNFTENQFFIDIFFSRDIFVKYEFLFYFRELLKNMNFIIPERESFGFLTSTFDIILNNKNEEEKIRINFGALETEKNILKLAHFFSQIHLAQKDFLKHIKRQDYLRSQLNLEQEDISLTNLWEFIKRSPHLKEFVD